MNRRGRTLAEQGEALGRGWLSIGYRPRFSLRTLLVFVVLLCCPLAWLGERMRSTQEQLAVLAKLERFGPGIVMAQGNVKLLSLGSTEVSDAELRDIGRLVYLERLDLEGTRITDAGVAELAKLKRLRFLSLSMTNITNAGLASFCAT